MSNNQYFSQETFFNESATFYKDVSIASNLNVTGDLSLSGSVIGNLTGNLTGNVTGNVTGNIVSNTSSTFRDINLSGKFYDGNNVFGASGQILSSNGTTTLWINASAANVGSATSVGTNLDSTNASRYLTFVDTTSGNNVIKVDSDLTYNPSTNAFGNIQTGILTASALKVTNGLYDESNSLGSSGQILSSTGSATLWINASSANVGSANSIAISADSTNASRYLTFVDTTSGNNVIKVDSDLTYNPSTNTITSSNFSGNLTGNVTGNVTGGVFVAINSQTSAYILASSDFGKLISITTGGVTVPQNTFSAGQSILIYNNSASSQTITQGLGVTLRLPGTSDTGSRTLQQRGLASILCIASNEFLITGTGLL